MIKVGHAGIANSTPFPRQGAGFLEVAIGRVWYLMSPAMCENLGSEPL